jgi:N,N-dimethylformamidase beta subunit-like protein
MSGAARTNAKWIVVAITALCLIVSNIAAAPTRALAAPDPENPVAVENQQPGTTAWQLGGSISDDVNGQIKGYGSATSVGQGQSITFRVTVNPAQPYTIDFYRIGWYGGLGGRLRLHVGPLDGVQQPPCPVDSITGLIACSWAASYTLSVPNDWTSGIYLAVLTNAAGYQNHVPFVVRDGRPADFLYQQAITTDQAYNNWPDDGVTGKSLYSFNSSPSLTVSGEKRAVKVSFDRPYSYGGAGHLFQGEINLVRWLERSGYDVTYSTDLDTHQTGGALRNYKGFISAGHDEYWSKQMYDAVQAARDAGVNLAFTGANAAYWQVRFENSDRVMVCYKSAALDPVQGPTMTVNFRDAQVNRAEQGLIGVQFTADLPAGQNVGYVVTNSSHWIYAGTGFKDGDVVPGIVGYEMDRFMSNYPAPPGTNRTLLSHSPFVVFGQSDYANSSIYQAPSGAWVFATGTLSWNWGLDNFYYNVADARIQRTTANLLDAFVNGAPTVDHLAVSGPASATAGQSFNVTVSAVNAQGNTVPSYSGRVHFTSSDTSSGVVLPADATLTNGTGSFPVTLTKAGAQTVTATDTASVTITGRASIAIGPAAAANLGLVAPTSAKATQPFNVTVTLTDRFGNVATGYRGTVHFTSTDPLATLPANYAFSAADAGVHTFAVTLVTPTVLPLLAKQTITVTDTANATLRATSAPITVNALP